MSQASSQALFSSFRPGAEIGVSDWVLVDQEMIDRFSAVTLDHDPMHVDPGWARERGPFGHTIAFGFLTVSLLSHLLHSALETIAEWDPAEAGYYLNYGFDRLRLISPVPVGSRIRAHFRVRAVWRDTAHAPSHALMTRSRVACALFALTVGAVLLASWPVEAADDEAYDLVLRNCRVIDAESRLDATRNVGVRDGKIDALSTEPLRGRRTIDATGLVVAPGFIDLHAHGQQLPAARMQAFDGVTTALELEIGTLPVSRFYEAAAQEGRPINYGAAVSWAAARYAYAVFNDLSPAQLPGNPVEMLKSDNWVHDIANPEQIERTMAALDAGLREGALGVGVLLGYAPGSGNKEYYAVNKLAARYAVPSYTHVRYASVIEPKSAFEAYEELVATAAATGAHMHICHLNSTSGRDIELAAEMISAAQKRGLAITVEAHPYPVASTAIGSAFFRGPDWQARLGGLRYEDFELNGEALDERRFNELQKNKPETIITVRYLRPETNPKDDDYLDISVLYPGGAIASDGMWWMHEGKRVDGDVWPLPLDAYAHPRSAGTFSRLLRGYVRETGKLTLMQAIEKASLIPARILEKSVPQMKNKGRIKPGADADLIVFDPATVSDRATFGVPAQTSVGMRYVIVNGTPVIADGKLVRNALPGRPIRRQMP